MKIKLFTISNLLTLSNLLCGMIATVAILTDGDLHLAFWLLVLAAAAIGGVSFLLIKRKKQSQ